MKKLRISLLCLVMLSLSLVLAACGGETEKEEAVGAVNIVIEYPEGENVSGEAAIYEGDSYLDCTQTFCREEKIPIVVEGTTYVTVDSINNIASGDYGDTYGWIYLINGEMIMDSAADVSAEDGANVIWRYADMNDMSME